MLVGEQEKDEASTFPELTSYFKKNDLILVLSADAPAPYGSCAASPVAARAGNAPAPPPLLLDIRGHRPPCSGHRRGIYFSSLSESSPSNQVFLAKGGLFEEVEDARVQHEVR